MNAINTKQYFDTILACYGLSAHDISPISAGIINDTYLVTCAESQYVLQCINQEVFTDVRAVTANIPILASRYRNAHVDADEREFITLVKTVTGDVCAFDKSGGAWRVTRYIGGAFSPSPENATPNQLFEAGRVTARFEGAFVGMSDDAITPAFYSFHNPLARYRAMCDAYKKGNGDDVYDVLKSLYGRVTAILKHHADDLVTVVHNDTKLSNILFDTACDKALCLIDLDTVGYGNVMYDFGDLARSVLAKRQPGEESAVIFALAEGYIPLAAHFISRDEVMRLGDGVFLVTFELCARYLADYYAGERYFHTAYRGECLDKARALSNLHVLSDNARMQKEISAYFTELYDNRLEDI